MNRHLLIILLLISSFSFGQDCLSSMKDLFKNGELPQEKVHEFLNLQASITMHKLAYATLSRENKETFSFEESILKLLKEKQNKKDSDEGFQKAMMLFEKNKLSRKSLAGILPYLKTILEEQSHTESRYIREKFNLNSSDIKLMAILAEKEKSDFRQFKNHTKDQSILNFTKIINSSIRNTKGGKSNILDRMSRRIEEMNNKAFDLIKELNPECAKKLLSCSVKEGAQPILPQEASGSFLEILSTLENPDRHKYLRYGDVWLYTGKGALKLSHSAQTIRKKYSGKPAKYPPYKVQSEKDLDQNIHEKLVSDVLRAVPQLFSKKDLLEDRELTVAIAQAIDRGVITAKYPNRYFTYKGKRYSFPETISDLDLRTKKEKDYSKEVRNFMYSQLGGNKYSLKVKGEIPKRSIKLSEIKDFPAGISAKEIKAFLKARSSQVYKLGKKATFSFKGELYLVKDGQKFEKNKEFFLNNFEKGSSKEESKAINPFDLKKEDKEQFIRELSLENRSFIKNGKVFHLSGEPVNLDREYKKSKIYFNSASKDGNNKDKFLNLKDIKKEVSSSDSNYNKLFIKAITDRKRTFPYKGMLVNARTAKKYKVENPYQLSATLNNEPIFFKENKEFITKTGEEVSARRSLAHIKSHDYNRSYENRVNQKNDKAIISSFHEKRSNSCKAYTILDKKNAEITVFSNSGTELFKAEVLLGELKGDAKTKYTIYSDSQRVTNKFTQAGRFEFGKVKRSSVSGERFVEVDGVIAGISAVSRTNPQRYSLFNDGDRSNNRVTGGGIVLRPRSFSRLLNFVKLGCPYYVLSDNEQRFSLQEGQLYFSGEKRKTKVKDIEIKVDPSFKINKTTSEFISALENEKRTIMGDLKLTDSEYNELAKIAVGILGAESKFGKTDIFEGFGVNRYGLKNSWLGGFIVWSGKLLKRGESDLDGSERSRGLTQIKHVEEYMQNTSYKHINKKLVKKPKYAAIATMYVLSDKLKQLNRFKSGHEGIEEGNKLDYLYYLYMGQGNQIKNATATPDFNPKVRTVNEIANKVVIDYR